MVVPVYGNPRVHTLHMYMRVSVVYCLSASNSSLKHALPCWLHHPTLLHSKFQFLACSSYLPTSQQWKHVKIAAMFWNGSSCDIFQHWHIIIQMIEIQLKIIWFVYAHAYSMCNDTSVFSYTWTFFWKTFLLQFGFRCLHTWTKTLPLRTCCLCWRRQIAKPPLYRGLMAKHFRLFSLWQVLSGRNWQDLIGRSCNSLGRYVFWGPPHRVFWRKYGLA